MAQWLAPATISYAGLPCRTSTTLLTSACGRLARILPLRRQSSAIFLTPRQAIPPNTGFCLDDAPRQSRGADQFRWSPSLSAHPGNDDDTGDLHGDRSGGFSSRLLLPEVLPGAVIVNTLRDRSAKHMPGTSNDRPVSPADRPPQKPLDTITRRRDSAGRIRCGTDRPGAWQRTLSAVTLAGRCFPNRRLDGFHSSTRRRR